MLREYLRRHDGVLTLDHARSVGMSKDAVSRRVRSGQWLRCARGVYFVNDRPFSDAARVRVAVWSLGPHAAASGLAAAWWHNLTQFAPDPVEVTMPRNASGRALAGVRLRRRDLADVDIVELNGLRATALPLTVIEAATRIRDGAKILDHALQRDLVGLSDLWRAQLRNKGRYGSPAARMLLQAASDGARSAAERLLIKLLTEAGITGWVANYPVGGYKVDVAFVRQKIAIEADGLAFHIGSVEFHGDRVRQNAITMLGWTVLRFTWLDLTAYPDRVIAIIRSATRV
ncbi:DUF559 domain-containing protein [Mycolicibacterium phlei]